MSDVKLTGHICKAISLSGSIKNSLNLVGKVNIPITISNTDITDLIERDIVYLSLPGNLSRIGNYAFADCTNLNIYSIPSSVSYIGESAFLNCKSLSISNIPSTVNTIQRNAFNGCTSIKNITFEGKPSLIGANAFANCTNLVTITCPWYEGDVEGAPWGASGAEITYLKNKTTWSITCYTNQSTSDYSYNTTVSDGETLSFSFTANEGYKITGITATMNEYSFDTTNYLTVTNDGKNASINNVVISGDMVITVHTDTVSSTEPEPIMHSVTIYENNSTFVVSTVSSTPVSVENGSQLYSGTLRWKSNNGYKITGLTATMGGETLDLSGKYGISVDDNNLYNLSIYASDIIVTGDIVINIVTESNGNTENPDIPSESIYTVTDEPNAEYGFTLNSDGWYVNNNKGISNSASLARISLSLESESTVRLICIDYAEPTWDFGILSEVDKTLITTNAIDENNVYYSFRYSEQGGGTNTETYVDYTVPSGSHFIVVKFRKDDGGNSNDDSFKFKVQIL